MPEEATRKKIFNKNLGISEDDVKAETSVSKLVEWRFDLFGQLTSMTAGVNDANELSQNVFVYFRYTKALYKMVRMRISDLREMERSYCRQFEDVASKRLDDDTYERIAREATERINAFNDRYVESNEDEFNDIEL